MKRACTASTYSAGFASIVGAVGSWLTSVKAEPSGTERADRWEIFVGEWAPTFFALGLAPARYEERDGALAP